MPAHSSNRSMWRLAASGALVPIALGLGFLTGCSAGGSGGSSVRPGPPVAVQVAAGVPTPAAVPPGRTVTASAEGRAEGAPDLLTVSLGVQTRNHSAQGALADNSTKAHALIAKLKGDGVVDNDIQTAQLQVSPEYSGGGPGGPPTVTGYVVNNIVTAKLRKLERAGSLIDDAVAAAGNDARVNAIGYSIDDDSALLANARADAVRQAQVRAKSMAQAAGVTLGPVRAITDVSQPQMQPMYFGAAGAAGGVASNAAPPLQPGTQRLTVNVVVVFDLA
ncbi:MAG: SIMPL domain-containing protein [Acidimicrobiales bacterium]